MTQPEHNPAVEAVIDFFGGKRNPDGTVEPTTSAIALFVLDSLRDKCPLAPSDYLTKNDTLSRARDKAHFTRLRRYGIPERMGLTGGITTRAGAGPAKRLFERLDHGHVFDSMTNEQRDALLSQAIDLVKQHMIAWIERQCIEVNLDASKAPVVWIAGILDAATGKSKGRVEQHLVEAKLAKRHPRANINNHRAFAADDQTERSGDIPMGSITYHITASPGVGVIAKCKLNIQSNLHPVLIVPRAKVKRATEIAKSDNLADRISIVAMEDFIANNVIEIAADQGLSLHDAMCAVLKEYNKRSQVEGDDSLRIKY